VYILSILSHLCAVLSSPNSGTEDDHGKSTAKQRAERLQGLLRERRLRRASDHQAERHLPHHRQRHALQPVQQQLGRYAESLLPQLQRHHDEHRQVQLDDDHHSGATTDFESGIADRRTSDDDGVVGRLRALHWTLRIGRGVGHGCLTTTHTKQGTQLKRGTADVHRQTIVVRYDVILVQIDLSNMNFEDTSNIVFVLLIDKLY